VSLQEGGGMYNFEECYPKLVLKKMRTVKSICEPLECLGIPIFSYGRIEDNGNAVHLTNCANVSEIYYGEKLYLDDAHAVHPFLLRSGIVFMPDNHFPADVQKLFKEANISHMLLILEHSDDLTEKFFFGIKSTNKKQATVLITYLDLLMSFIRYFKREASDLINKARKENFNIKSTLGKVFVEGIPTPLLNTDPQVKRFLNMVNPLTTRERQCLELFKKGKTAQMTGAILGISQRTVEHYFDNIKNKLGCSSKADLLLW
jgi:DNA-binding CsgD family transcriptional regulator